MIQKNNQVKTGLFLSYISRIIQIFVGLLYTPLMIRLLGQSEYGIYNIAASIIAYLGILNFGFGSAYIRFYSRYKVGNNREKIAKLNGMFFSIFLFLGILVIISGGILVSNVELIFGPSLSNNELLTAKKLMIILLINFSAAFPAVVFNTYVQANEKFIFQNVLQIIRQITTPLINLPLLFLGYGSVGMVIGTAIINISVEIINALYAIKRIDMKFDFKGFDRLLLKEMTIYSSFIFINMLVDQINNNVDKTIIGRYQGSVSVAIYSIAATLNMYYSQISTTVSNVLTPRVHRLVASNASDWELTKFFTRIGRVQFLLLSLVISGFIFLGKPFINIWAGADYDVSYFIALLLMIPITVPLIQNLGTEIQRAKNMHQFRSWLYLFIALVNIIVSIPLTIKYGAVGASIGTAGSMFLGNGIIMNLYYHKKVGLNMIYFWKKIFKFTPAFVLPCIYGILINIFVDLYNLKNLFIFGLFYLLIYIVSFWCLGMNKYEKSLIKRKK